jgi:hypothetical protein
MAKTGGSKRARLSGFMKLDDANKAGTKDGYRCTLILTEGDSAKALTTAGLGIVGRDLYGGTLSICLPNGSLPTSWKTSQCPGCDARHDYEEC